MPFFLSGVGVGVIGAVVKPLGGAVDLFAHTSHGVIASLTEGSSLETPRKHSEAVANGKSHRTEKGWSLPDESERDARGCLNFF